MVTETFRMTPRAFAESALFSRTFDEGMDLVEETAAYLEGPGRQASRELDRAASLAYAAESMRLTTRLMQVASWLLVHRAVREGEIEETDANQDRFRLSGSVHTLRDDRDLDAELPAELRKLIERGDVLFSRVARLDLRMDARVADTEAQDVDPVGAQLASLADAFGAQRTPR